MITTIYNYSSGTGFSYDNTQIGFVGGSAQLLLQDNPGQTFSPDLSAATFDSNVIEYVGGNLRQKDQRPANATFFASWSAMLNANWSGAGNGSLVVNPLNGAAIAGSSLDLTGSSNKYVTMSATNNMDSLLHGTLQFQWTPNYNGSPSETQIMVNISDAANSKGNLIDLEHFSDGNIYLEIYAQDGTTLGLQIMTPFTAVAGQTYLLVVNFDATIGTANIYIDGALQATVTTGAFTRSGPVTYAVIGKYYDANEGGNANFSIKNLSYYSTVEIPGSVVLNPTAFNTGMAVLPNFTYPGMGAVQSYTAFSTTESNAPQYTMSGNYWNGSGWVISNETYPQSNPAATVEANVLAMPATNTMHVRVFYIAGNLQQSVHLVTLTYTGQNFSQNNPTIVPTSQLSIDQLTVFTETATIPGNTAVMFYLVIGVINYWYNGSAWVISDGSLAQSNTAAAIQTNASSLPTSGGVFFSPVAILSSSNGNNTPELMSLLVTYDFSSPPVIAPLRCDVFGFLMDILDQIQPTVEVGSVLSPQIQVTSASAFFYNTTLIQPSVKTANIDEDGEFRIQVVETTSFPPAVPYQFTLIYMNDSGIVKQIALGSGTVPNVPTASLASILAS